MKYKTTSEQIRKHQQIELKQRNCTDRIGREILWPLYKSLAVCTKFKIYTKETQISSSQFNHPSSLFFHPTLFKYSVFYISKNATHLPQNSTLWEDRLLFNRKGK